VKDRLTARAVLARFAFALLVVGATRRRHPGLPHVVVESPPGLAAQARVMVTAVRS